MKTWSQHDDAASALKAARLTLTVLRPKKTTRELTISDVDTYVSLVVFVESRMWSLVGTMMRPAAERLWPTDFRLTIFGPLDANADAAEALEVARAESEDASSAGEQARKDFDARINAARTKRGDAKRFNNSPGGGYGRSD